MTLFIQHAAYLDRNSPPGSLSSLQKCLLNQVEWIEVDIIPLKGGDFALLHDPKLENISTGQGDAIEKTALEIQALSYSGKYSGGEKVSLGTLSQAVQMMMEVQNNSHLQLDLKPYAALTPDVLKNLLALIDPIKEKIIVSCVADWAVRHLRKMDSSLMLGFDPLLYLDMVNAEPRPEGIPPFRVGAFGYLDDHPLAAQKWGKHADYFAMRAEALLCQVPKGITWFINTNLLIAALDAGFNWIRVLKEKGSKVDAWTIDLDQMNLAKRLIAEEIDFITSNDAYLLEKQFQSQ